MTVTMEEVEKQLEEKEDQIRALEDDLEEAWSENDKKEERIRQMELQLKKRARTTLATARRCI